MKLLFVARHFTYFRNFEGVVRLLAERGHHVHLADEGDEALGGRELVDRLAAASPLVTVGHVPPRADERWFEIATVIRRSLDYLRYSDALYDRAPKIRERAWERTPQLAVSLARWPGRRVIERALAAMDRALPIDAAIDAFLDEQKPDVVLVSPLIELGSPQADIVKAAQRRGIHSSVAIWSWDHLSSKARLRWLPERVFVWNDTQRQEAIDLHDVPSARIVTTGAQCFDHWFGRRPSRSREEFCRDVGLNPARPFILYVCSALFRGSPSEAEFACRWAEHLKHSHVPLVRDAGLLVRPHPQRMYEWEGVTLPDGVAFLGGHPIDQRGRDDYFDSMHHAAAVVGLNTSALIECAIVDRPVLTLLLPEFRDSQRGTLHFPYLVDGPHAMLHAASDLDEHITQLESALAGRLPNLNTAFVRHFIRPHGVDRAAAPVFVDALESQAASPAPAPQRPAIGDAIWSPVVHSWHAAVERPSVRWMMLEAAHVVEERERAQRIADKQARRRAHDDERQARVDAKGERYRVKRRQQRMVQLKTVVRRVLTAGAGRAGSQS